MFSSLTLVPMSLGLAANTWTVDDNGPADFPSLVAAVAAVADGDTLIVKAGSYAGFSTNKSLVVLGDPTTPLPTIQSPVSVANAAHFTLAGFRVKTGLSLGTVPGRITIDDSVIDGIEGVTTVTLTSCFDVVLSRTTVKGAIHTLALAGSASNVRITACSITGGEHPDYTPPYDGDGALAILVDNHSRVAISGSKVEGGFAGYADVGAQGESGGAIRAQNGSLVLVRGLSSHLIYTGGYSPFGEPAPVIEVLDTSRVIVSGVTVNGPLSVAPTASLDLLATPEPWLRILGNDAPGNARKIQLFGPPGAAALLFVGAAPGWYSNAAADLPLWMDPLSLIVVLPVTTASTTTPLELKYAIPTTPGLAGTAFELQAAFPTLPGSIAPGTIAMTNGETLLLRY